MLAANRLNRAAICLYDKPAASALRMYSSSSGVDGRRSTIARQQSGRGECLVDGHAASHESLERLSPASEIDVIEIEAELDRRFELFR